MRRVGRLVGGLVLTLAVTGALAATASAAIEHAGGITYVTKDHPAKSGKFKMRATCPSGTHVMGGGARAFGDFDAISIAQSYPVDRGDADKKPDDAWEAAVNGEGGPWDWSVYATCTQRKLTYVQESFKAQPMALTNELVFCPNGKDLVGGGEKAGFQIFQNSGFPAAGYWAFYEDSFQTTKVPFVGYAICAGFNTHVSSGQITVPNGTDGGLSVGCGAPGEFVVSGGTSNGGGHGDATVKFSYPDNSTLWASATNNHSGGSMSVSVHVVCVKHL